MKKVCQRAIHPEAKTSMTTKVLIFCAACCALVGSVQAQTGRAPLTNPAKRAAEVKAASTKAKEAARRLQTASASQALQSVAEEQLRLTREQTKAANQQATAANRQVWAAWVQALIALGTVVATLLLLSLTRKQIGEMVNQRDEMKAQREAVGVQTAEQIKEMVNQRTETRLQREETVKARALSLMPVLTCSINDDYLNKPEYLENNGGTYYLKASTVKLENSGNATALATHMRIEQTDGSPFFQVVTPEYQWHTVNAGDPLERKLALLPPFSAYKAFPAKPDGYTIRVTIEYINGYKQKFVTTAHFLLKPYVAFSPSEKEKLTIVMSKWQKTSEEFELRGWS